MGSSPAADTIFLGGSMSFWENIKKFFSNEISDEEVANNEWVQCPKCLVHVLKEDLIDNDCKCLNCSSDVDVVVQCSNCMENVLIRDVIDNGYDCPNCSQYIEIEKK